MSSVYLLFACRKSIRWVKGLCLLRNLFGCKIRSLSSQNIIYDERWEKLCTTPDDLFRRYLGSTTLLPDKVND